MDRPLTAELRPTKLPALLPALPEPQSKVASTILTTKLQHQSVALLRHPYDPSGWIARSATLTALGFPELAVGDAYKAIRLCETMLDFWELRHGEKWCLGNGSGFWMRDESTIETGGERDDVCQLTNALDAFIIQAHQLQEANFCYRHYSEGKYIPQDYPWLEAKHRTRAQSVLDEISVDISLNEAKTVSGLPCIQVKRCTFRPGEEDESDSASLGIFAACTLPKDTRILVDRTKHFGCNGPGPRNCRANLGGALGCENRLHPKLADDEGNHDLRWVRERTGKRAADPLLLCRILLDCVQSNVESPLDLPEIARLTATYHTQNPKTFRLDRDIAIINDALVQLGIDIFANQKYDTWVLFTVLARVNNNSWTNPIAAGLNPLFALFNHSCDPNVDWTTRKDHRTVEMRLSKDVVEGEQLFVEYDSFVHDEAVAERRRRLAKWIDGPCMCSRCVFEEQALLLSQSHDKNTHGGNGGDTAVLPGLLPCNGNGNGSTLPAWDTGERPTLPEDAYWAAGW